MGLGWLGKKPLSLIQKPRSGTNREMGKGKNFLCHYSLRCS
jgi:hypothetical protein